MILAEFSSVTPFPEWSIVDAETRGSMSDPVILTT